MTGPTKAAVGPGSIQLNQIELDEGLVISERIIERLKADPSLQQDATPLSYTKDFKKIWSSTWDKPGWIPSGDIIIVWDMDPSHHKDLDSGIRNFLTVYDWAAAMAVKASNSGAGRGEFDFRLQIIEVVSKAAWPRSFAIKTLPLLGAIAETGNEKADAANAATGMCHTHWSTPIMPWMKVFAWEELDGLVDAAGTGPTLREFSKYGAESDRGFRAADLIRRLWTSEVTNAGQRHSISNIIGPAALAQSLKVNGYPVAERVLGDWDQEEGGARRAFWRFLEILGLLRPWTRSGTAVVKPALGGFANDPFVVEDLFGRFRTMDFALVDDQANSGFHDALAAFLLGPGASSDKLNPRIRESDPVARSHSRGRKFNLTSFDHPRVLLEALRRAVTHHSNPWSQPRIFGRGVEYAENREGEARVPEFDVLFLDLRLHGISGSAAEREKARRWRVELLNFLDVHIGEISDEHAGIPDQQRSALKTASDAARARMKGLGDDGSGLAELALLPILISICDPTMPIVLFSSTQQRGVLDLLDPFPNIEKCFAKPAITGYAKDDQYALESASACLEKALRRVLDLHEKRCIWHLLAGFNLDQAVPPRCIVVASDGENSTRRYPANVSQPWDLPFVVNYTYRRRFFDIAKSQILATADLDRAYRPYEFVESSLFCNKRDADDQSFDMLFTAKSFRKVDQNLAPTVRSHRMQDLKRARVFVVHGYGTRRELDDEVVGYLCSIVFIQLVEAIANSSLKRRVEIFSKQASPLVRSLLLTRNIAMQSGILSDRLTALLTVVWPTKPRVNP